MPGQLLHALPDGTNRATCRNSAFRRQEIMETRNVP
jgi:hypothetical protein